MSRSTVLAAISVLLSIPVMVAWVFALVDVARRRDLGIECKIAYGAVLVAVVPVTLLYLLSRPSVLVGPRTFMRTPSPADDWRRTLISQIELADGAPPVASPSESRDMLERVNRLRLNEEGVEAGAIES